MPLHLPRALSPTDLDDQLRRVFVNPAYDAPLLGGEADGPFVLGYCQVSKMPAALKDGSNDKISEVDKYRATPAGRGLGAHRDSDSYGEVRALMWRRTHRLTRARRMHRQVHRLMRHMHARAASRRPHRRVRAPARVVLTRTRVAPPTHALANTRQVIITVTVYGHVQIILRKSKDLTGKTEVFAAERGSGTAGGDVCIYSGYAYALWGKARWKMHVRAPAPPQPRAAPRHTPEAPPPQPRPTAHLAWACCASLSRRSPRAA